MAKAAKMVKPRQQETGPAPVTCPQCALSVGPVDNFLVGCSSKAANPHGYKMGTYKRTCRYFTPKA